MIQERIDQIPIRYRLGSLYALLGVVALVALAAAAYLGTSNVIVQNHTKVVQKTWGRPDQSIPAGQVNAQLAQAGMTVCDYYAGKATLVCH